MSPGLDLGRLLADRGRLAAGEVPGIARLTADESTMLLGSPLAMTPEQTEGEPAVDIYALGDGDDAWRRVGTFARRQHPRHALLDPLPTHRGRESPRAHTTFHRSLAPLR